MKRGEPIEYDRKGSINSDEARRKLNKGCTSEMQEGLFDTEAIRKQQQRRKYYSPPQRSQEENKFPYRSDGGNTDHTKSGSGDVGQSKHNKGILDDMEEDLEIEGYEEYKTHEVEERDDLSANLAGSKKKHGGRDRLYSSSEVMQEKK
jgi:hypothetical protein